MDRETLTSKWGFIEYPFKTFGAEKEDNLAELFIEPPYFSDILGDTGKPTSSVVFGRRGDGKTSIFKMVIHRLLSDRDNKYLIVKYIDFSEWTAGDIIKLTFKDHLEKIMGLAIDRFISDIESDPSLLQNIKDDDLNKLQWFILRFLSRAGYEQVEKRLINLLDKKLIPRKSVYITGKGFRRVASWFRRKRFEIEHFSDNESSAVQTIKAIIILLAPSMPGREELERESILNLFFKFRDIVISAGYRSIYILLDKVDETEACSGNYPLVSSLVSPIVKTIGFLETEKAATKLFLPSWTREYLGKDLRTDKILTRDIRWNTDRLRAILKKRLMAFSDGNIDTLEPFVDKSIWPLFELKTLFYSAESPRNLFRLLDHIISELCELEVNPSKITLTALDTGIKHFQSIRVGEFDSTEYEAKLHELETSDYFRQLFAPSKTIA
jgi:hypothetical protein